MPIAPGEPEGMLIAAAEELPDREALPDPEMPPAAEAVPAPIPLMEDLDPVEFIPDAEPIAPWLPLPPTPDACETDPGAALNLASAICSMEFRISTFSSATDISFLTL